MKKLASKPINSNLEDLPEEVPIVEEIILNTPIVDEVPIEKIDTSAIDLTIDTEEIVEVPEKIKETETNSLPDSSLTQELPPPSTDIISVSEDTNSTKKIPDEESVKPGNTFMFILLLHLTLAILEE